MGTLYKFRDKEDGIVKWGEISIAYDPNLSDGNIPVVILNDYKDAGELRVIQTEDILEER